MILIYTVGVIDMSQPKLNYDVGQPSAGHGISGLGPAAIMDTLYTISIPILTNVDNTSVESLPQEMHTLSLQITSINSFLEKTVDFIGTWFRFWMTWDSPYYWTQSKQDTWILFTTTSTMSMNVGNLFGSISSIQHSKGKVSWLLSTCQVGILCRGKNLENGVDEKP